MSDEKLSNYVNIDDVDVSDIDSFSFFVKNSTYTFSNDKWYVNGELFELSDGAWSDEEIKHVYIISGKLQPLIDNFNKKTNGEKE